MQHVKIGHAKVTETPSRTFAMMDSDGSGNRMFFAVDKLLLKLFMKTPPQNALTLPWSLFGRRQSLPGSLDFSEFLRSSAWNGINAKGLDSLEAESETREK